MTATPSYRFLLRPKWIAFHLLIGTLVIVMVNLGFWQLRRLDQRREFNRAVRVASTQPVADLAAVLKPGAGDPHTVEWRRVRTTGHYEPGGQVVVANRSLGGRGGFDLVAPLRLADGRAVLVERGFLPEGAAIAPPPPGDVQIEGYLRVSQARRALQASDPDDGVLATVQRVDVARLDRQIDGDLVPMYLQLTTSSPADDDVARIPLPELSEGPHLSYAGQWFLFSAAALAGWIILVRTTAHTRAGIRDKRRKGVLPARTMGAPTTAATPPPATPPATESPSAAGGSSASPAVVSSASDEQTST